MNPLVTAWIDAITGFQDTVGQVPDADFAAPSLLPGWTVGDIIAHTAALEAELAGHPLIPHEPDWDTLPHAQDLFSRYTELGVDARRGWTPDQVRAELAAVAVERTAQLESGPQNDDEPIAGIGGQNLTFGRQLRMRCFDIVLHDLDIRDALSWPPPLFGDGARVCVEQIAGALGYVWVKKAGAQAGQVLHLVVPGWVDAWVGVGPDGRGRAVEPGAPTTEITVDVEQFLRLGSGRRGDLAKALVTGDVDLGERLLAALNIAP